MSWTLHIAEMKHLRALLTLKRNFSTQADDSLFDDQLFHDNLEFTFCWVTKSTQSVLKVSQIQRAFRMNHIEAVKIKLMEEVNSLWGAIHTVPSEEGVAGGQGYPCNL